MATFLDYLHGHVFTYIVLALLVAVALSALLSRKECAAFSPVDRLAGAVGGRAPFWAVLISVALAWAWIVLMPIGYGHRDEIALLTQPLQPTMYSGRFFPLGHMEFNVISLSLTDGALAPLYILPFLQLLAVVFFIDRIVSPAGALVRIYAMVLSFVLALVVPFVNLIVPERNAIFFLLASLYFIKRYREAPGLLTVALAVGLLESPSTTKSRCLPCGWVSRSGCSVMTSARSSAMLEPPGGRARRHGCWAQFNWVCCCRACSSCWVMFFLSSIRVPPKVSMMAAAAGRGCRIVS